MELKQDKLLRFVFLFFSICINFLILSWFIFIPKQDEKLQSQVYELVDLTKLQNETEKKVLKKRPSQKFKKKPQKNVLKKENVVRQFDAATEPVKSEKSEQEKQEKESPLLKKEKRENIDNFDAQQLFRQTVQKKKVHPRLQVPEEIQEELKNNLPEKTSLEHINFTLNTYEWNYQDYISHWAIQLKKWWRLPVDYGTGKVPDGGSVWIKVTVGSDGNLENYHIYKTTVTSEMKLKVVQTLLSSFKLPNLPQDFPKDQLVVNWQFIYLPYNEFHLFQKN